MNEVSFKEYHLGFIAARNHIMTSTQVRSLRTTLDFFNKINPEVCKFFHVVDTLGASSEAFEMALERGFKLATHPPLSVRERAFLAPYDLAYAATYDPYKQLVDRCHLVLFALDTQDESSSAVWESIKYANVSYKTWKILKAPMAAAQGAASAHN
jgi:hypothetical protein